MIVSNKFGFSQFNNLQSLGTGCVSRLESPDKDVVENNESECRDGDSHGLNADQIVALRQLAIVEITRCISSGLF